jgi:hypothetical protein
MFRRVLSLWVLVFLLVAGCSSHARVHNYGAVHTRLGGAQIYCGGKYTGSCNGEAALVFRVCSKSFENYFAPLKKSLTPSRLDLLVRSLVGKEPPTGGRWVDARCGGGAR